MEVIKEIIERRREEGTIRDLLDLEVMFIDRFKQKLKEKNAVIDIQMDKEIIIHNYTNEVGHLFIQHYLDELVFEKRFVYIEKLYRTFADIQKLTRFVKIINEKYIDFIEEFSDTNTEYIDMKGIIVKLGDYDIKALEVLLEQSHLTKLAELTTRYQSKNILKVLPSVRYKLRYLPENGSYQIVQLEGDVEDIFETEDIKENRFLYDALPPAIFEKVLKHILFTEKHGLEEFSIDYGPRTYRSILRKELLNGSAIEIVGETLDITDVKKSDEVNRKLAYYDTLTGLANRELFTDTLDRAISDTSDTDNTFLATMFVDVDDFKSINDTYGHGIGDEVLKEVAKRLKLCIRQGDMACRYAGDEFTVLCRNLKSKKDLVCIVNRIMKTITSEPVKILSKMVNITLSIGIALYPKDTDNALDLLKCADLAMYESKNNGKNQYHFFTKCMRAEELKNEEMKNGLTNAIKRNELFLEYMIQYDSEKNAITGMESLLRWNHPTRGIIPAGEFIPVAESSGLILQMGYWALRKGCEDLKKLHNAGYTDITLSVNFSSLQFRQRNLVEQVSIILNETGLEPKYLMVEISESTSMIEAARSSTILDELTNLGVRICLDDFGTGYSNIEYLSIFDLSNIKLDKSIVTKLEGDKPKESETLLRTMIKIGETLKIDVMSEGIETENQYNILKSLGCTQFQGYYFGKPKRINEVLQYLESN